MFYFDLHLKINHHHLEMVSVSLKPLDTWLSFLSVIHSLATISYFLPPNKNIFFFSRAHGVIIRFLLISVDRTGQSYIASHCIPSHKLSGSQMWMCGEKRMHFHYCFLCCYFLHTLLLLLFCFCFFTSSSSCSTVTLLQ